jgi:hypothetical protein
MTIWSDLMSTSKIVAAICVVASILADRAGYAEGGNTRFDAPMQFTMASNGNNCDDCEWINATGAIDRDTPQRLQQYLDNEKAKWGLVDHLIIFNSPGGDLIAGIRLGKMLRWYKMTADVGATSAHPAGQFEVVGPGLCLSACAYAYLGGIDRRLRAGSHLGFHQFRSEGKVDLAIPRETLIATGLSEGQIVSGVLTAYLVAMGVDARVLTLASAAMPNEIKILTDQELTQFGVLTPTGFGPLKIKAVDDGLIVYTERQNTDYPALSLALLCSGQKNTPHAIIALDNSYEKNLSKQNFVDVIRDVTLRIDGRKFILAHTKEEIQKILDVSSDEKAYYLDVSLSFEDAERLGGATHISIWLEAPHNFFDSGPHAWVDVDNTGRREVRLAFKNCI